MARSVIRVPRLQTAALGKLLRLTPEVRAALAQALSAAQPSFSIRSLAGQIAGQTSLDPDDVYDLVRVLTTLYTIRDREQLSPEQFLGEVERAAKASDAEDDLVDHQIDWNAVRQGVGQMLDARALGVTAKAFDVLSEHDRMFCDARVLTDIRPVFLTDVKQNPDALVLVHELRLSYHQDGEIKAIYIAMDSSDIEDLRSVLERASKKEASIEKFAEQGPVRVLKAESHES